MKATAARSIRPLFASQSRKGCIDIVTFKNFESLVRVGSSSVIPTGLEKLQVAKKQKVIKM